MNRSRVTLTAVWLVFVATVLLGCEGTGEHPSNGKRVLREAGVSQWDYVTDESAVITIRAYRFTESSPSVQALFDRYQELDEGSLDALERGIRNTRNRVQREGSESTIEALEKQLALHLRSVDMGQLDSLNRAVSWPQWPVIVLIPAMSEGMLLKLVCVGRYEQGETRADCVFAMSSTKPVDVVLFGAAVRELATQIGESHPDGIERVLSVSGRLLDDEGHITAECLREFFSGETAFSFRSEDAG